MRQFTNLIFDRNTIKVTIEAINGQQKYYVGFGLLCPLEIGAPAAYANIEFFKNHLSPTNRKKLFYVPAICILPKYAGQGIFYELVSKVLLATYSQNGALGFDTCDKNKNLKSMINHVFQQMKKKKLFSLQTQMNINTLDTQEFHGLTFEQTEAI